MKSTNLLTNRYELSAGHRKWALLFHQRIHSSLEIWHWIHLLVDSPANFVSAPCFAPWITAVADQMDLVLCCVEFLHGQNKTRFSRTFGCEPKHDWTNQQLSRNTLSLLRFHAVNQWHLYRQFSKHTVRGRFLPLHDQTWPTTTCAYSFKHFLNQLPNFRYQSSYNSQHIVCPVCFCEP